MFNIEEVTDLSCSVIFNAKSNTKKQIEDDAQPLFVTFGQKSTILKHKSHQELFADKNFQDKITNRQKETARNNLKITKIIKEYEACNRAKVIMIEKSINNENNDEFKKITIERSNDEKEDETKINSTCEIINGKIYEFNPKEHGVR